MSKTNPDFILVDTYIRESAAEIIWEGILGVNVLVADLTTDTEKKYYQNAIQLQLRVRTSTRNGRNEMF